MFKIKEQTNLVDQEYASGRPAPNTLFCFIDIYLQPKNKPIIYQSAQEILKIKEYLYLIGLQHTRGRAAPY